MAVAFGHMSGWRQVESVLAESKAEQIDVLLGQAFFQTEPELLYKLLNLCKNSTGPKFRAKLASIDSTFHPKAWIITGDECSEAIVGSGNLSEGGMVRNVECGLYTREPMNVAALEQWFDSQWALGSPLERSHELYIQKYKNLEQFKKGLRAKLRNAESEIADREASWRRKDALAKAIQYWNTEDGKAAVEQRRSAILRMRDALGYPEYNFTGDDWNTFLRIPELGRIRLGHAAKTIASIARLKSVLTKLKDRVLSYESAVDSLIGIPGIGRNLATKLVVVQSPTENVAFNEPIERALQSFGYPSPDGEFSGSVYRQLIRELSPFIEECEVQGLDRAAALDAFFYSYAIEQNLLPRQNPSSGASSSPAPEEATAILALVEPQWLNQALNELRDGKPEIYFGTDSLRVGPAFEIEPRSVYFKVTGKPEVVARAEFAGITDRNPAGKRLQGFANDAKWKYYYGFRSLINLETPVPLSELRDRNGGHIRNDLSGSCVISDPDL